MADYPMKRPSEFEARNPEQTQLFGEENIRNNNLLQALRQAGMTGAEKDIDKATNFTGNELPFDKVPPQDFLEHLARRKTDPTYNPGGRTLNDIGMAIQDKQEKLAMAALMRDKDLRGSEQLSQYLASQAKPNPNTPNEAIKSPEVHPTSDPSEIYKILKKQKVDIAGFMDPETNTIYSKPEDHATVGHETKHSIDTQQGRTTTEPSGESMYHTPSHYITTPTEAGLMYEAGHFGSPIDSVAIDSFKRLRQQLGEQ